MKNVLDKIHVNVLVQILFTDKGISKTNNLL